MKSFTLSLCLILGLGAVGHAHAQTAQAAVTFNNNSGGTATSSSINHDGTLIPTPASSVNNGQSDSYVNTGIGNITSVHVTYQSGSKKCAFNSSGNASGSSCTYYNVPTSSGGATCTETVTSQSTSSLNGCNFSVTWNMN